MTGLGDITAARRMAAQRAVESREQAHDIIEAQRSYASQDDLDVVRDCLRALFHWLAASEHGLGSEVRMAEQDVRAECAATGEGV